MKNLSITRDKNCNNSSDDSFKELPQKKVLKQFIEHSEGDKAVEKKSANYPSKSLKKQKSEPISKNYSPVCFAESEEIRDEYKIE